jgi:DNA-binding response OmpR family regulator
MARVLIIDDDPAMRSRMEQALKSAGYEVVVAENGREGLKEHRRNPANLIVTDLFMPEKDGIEVLTELRKDSSPPPIIAITGNAMGSSMVSLASGLGAARILAKPFRPDELLAAIEDVLRLGKPG